MGNRTITVARIDHFTCLLAQREKSRATVQKYRRDLLAFARYAGDGEITKELAIGYKQHLLERYAPASVNSMLAALNRFFKEMGWYDCTVNVVKIQRRAFRSQERELTRTEYLRLLDAARRRKDWRLYQLMQTLCATGIRVSELRFITVEAVERGSAVVSLKGKTRQILLPATLCRELSRYAKNKGIRRGSIFVTRSGAPMDRSNILHAMKALCQGAGVDPRKVFPHNLRHLFASLYYKASKDISHLADLLGHSSIDTTRIYTQVSCAEQRRQIDRLGLVIKNTA